MRAWLFPVVVVGLAVVASEARAEDNPRPRYVVGYLPFPTHFPGEVRADEDRSSSVRPLGLAHQCLNTLCCRVYGMFVAAQVREGMTWREFDEISGRLKPDKGQMSADGISSSFL